METKIVKPKEQLNVKVSTETLRCLDKLIDYDLIRNRSDAVAYAARIAAEHAARIAVEQLESKS
jgi:ribosomal protein L28